MSDSAVIAGAEIKAMNTTTNETLNLIGSLHPSSIDSLINAMMIAHFKATKKTGPRRHVAGLILYSEIHSNPVSQPFENPKPQSKYDRYGNKDCRQR